MCLYSYTRYIHHTPPHPFNSFSYSANGQRAAAPRCLTAQEPVYGENTYRGAAQPVVGSGYHKLPPKPGLYCEVCPICKNQSITSGRCRYIPQNYGASTASNTYSYDTLRDLRSTATAGSTIHSPEVSSLGAAPLSSVCSTSATGTGPTGQDTAPTDSMPVAGLPSTAQGLFAIETECAVAPGRGEAVPDTAGMAAASANTYTNQLGANGDTLLSNTAFLPDGNGSIIATEPNVQQIIDAVRQLAAQLADAIAGLGATIKNKEPSAPGGLLAFRDWWELVEVDVYVGGELLTGMPTFIEGGAMRVINAWHSYFIPLCKIDYIRTGDGLCTAFGPAGD